jgi:hypothetical protein
MQHADLDVAQFQFLVLRDAVKWELRARAGVQHVVSANGFGQLASTGKVVGMDVSVDNVADLHPGLLRDPQVRLNLFNRVAHGGQALAASTEDVRGRHDWLGMQELTQDHWYTSGNQ